MFTGIIEQPCPLVTVEERAQGRRLVLDLAPLRAPVAPRGGAGMDPVPPQAASSGGSPGAPLVALGDSVAVNGVCLTVALLDGDRAAFDVVSETLECTNLGFLAPGDRVNVERSLRYGDRVDGHLVQGHVETTGEVLRCEKQPGQVWLEVACGADFAARTLPKGSVTVDGVSLTVAELGQDRFGVALVPHTLQRTTLGERRAGHRVNLEPDMIGQWVLKAVRQSQG